MAERPFRGNIIKRAIGNTLLQIVDKSIASVDLRITEYNEEVFKGRDLKTTPELIEQSRRSSKNNDLVIRRAIRTMKSVWRVMDYLGWK